MAKFGRMEGSRNAHRFLADTYGLLYWVFDAEVVRVKIRLGFVVSLRPKGAAFGQAGSTRLDSASRTFFHQQIDFSEQKCFHQKQASMPSWHQSLGLELGPGASTVPTWSNLISSFDVWADAWLELQARFVGGIRGPEFRPSGISACEKLFRHLTKKTLAENCASPHWKFASYIIRLPHAQWVRRMLQYAATRTVAWHTGTKQTKVGRRLVGRPAMHWARKFEQISRIKYWYDWKDVAANAERWMVEVYDFVKFRTQ